MEGYAQPRSGQAWSNSPPTHAPLAPSSQNFNAQQYSSSVGNRRAESYASPQSQSGSGSFAPSPFAKEFVPRSALMENYDENELAMAMAMAQINMQQQQHQGQQGYQQAQGPRHPYQQENYQAPPPRHQQMGQMYADQPQQPRQHYQQPRHQQQQYQQQPRHQHYQPRPRQQQQQQHYQQPRQQHYRPRHQQRQYQHHQEPAWYDQVPSEFQAEPAVERVLTTVTDTIGHLTTNPGDFHTAVKRVIRVLQECLYDSDTLCIVITLIVEQSIANRNFSYTGAKMCQALNENGIQVGGVKVYQLLLSRVEVVFKTYMDSIKVNTAEMRGREIGLLFFLAELFTNYKLEAGGSFFGFGVAALEIMTNLIKDSPDRGIEEPSIKVVVQVLKMSGWELENHPNPKLRADMEKLMKEFACLPTMAEKISPGTREMIQRVIDMRTRNWDREETPNTTEPPSPNPRTESLSSETPNSYNGLTQHPVYELPESEEEEFLLDDEPDEVNKFYEEFLKNLP